MWLLLILSIIALWVGYKIWYAWPEIIATARAQAEAMDDMSITEAARYSLLGQTKGKE